MCKDCGEDGLTEMSTEGQQIEPLSVRVRAEYPQGGGLPTKELTTFQMVRIHSEQFGSLGPALSAQHPEAFYCRGEFIA